MVCENKLNSKLSKRIMSKDLSKETLEKILDDATSQILTSDNKFYHDAFEVGAEKDVEPIVEDLVKVTEMYSEIHAAFVKRKMNAKPFQQIHNYIDVLTRVINQKAKECDQRTIQLKNLYIQKRSEGKTVTLEIDQAVEIYRSFMEETMEKLLEKFRLFIKETNKQIISQLYGKLKFDVKEWTENVELYVKDIRIIER